LLSTVTLLMTLYDLCDIELLTLAVVALIVMAVTVVKESIIKIARDARISNSGLPHISLFLISASSSGCKMLDNEPDNLLIC